MDRQEAADLLEVAVDAPREDVDRAFRRLARDSHPDLGGDPARFRQVREARLVLMVLPRDAPARQRPRGGGPPLRVVSLPWWRRALRELALALPSGWRPRRRDLD